MAETANQRRDFRVAAAIDFGTHSTGFAWATVAARNDDPANRKIELNRQWADQPVQAAKTLSAVLLTADGAVEAWGYAARRKLSTGSAGPSSRYYYSFKRAMARRGEQDTGTFSRTPLPAHLPGDPEEARAITVAYLREIVRVAVARIEEAGYQQDDIRWCVTVPAIWDDAAMSLTRSAAVQAAGLPADTPRLQLVREPEAAALSCLADGAFHVGARLDAAATGLPRGARYLIVDGGGGTVDISAYEVDESGGLRQIGETLGGWLGSEYLNDAFINSILARRIGGVTKVSDLIRSDPEVLLDLADEWERQKLTVDAAVEPDGSVAITSRVAVRLSASAHAAILRVAPELENQLRDHIIIEPAELKETFDGVVTPILAVVDRELAAVAGKRPHGAPVDNVLLVGGFADCRYLRLRLRQHLKERATVHFPAYGADAILRGAVHYCYDSTTISARQSSYTYGFAVALPFENGLDPESSKMTDDDGEILCNDRFHPVVEIGQSVPIDHEYRTQVRPVLHDQTELIISLYTSTDQDPRYASACSARGTFTVDISATSGWRVPLDKRTVDLAFRFGSADITVTATETETGKPVTRVIAFERTDEDARADDRRAVRPGFGRLLPARRTRVADQRAADPDAITKKYAELADQRLLFVARELAGREVARTKASDLGRSTAACGYRLSRLLFGEAPPDRQQVFESEKGVSPGTPLARDLAKLVDDVLRLRATSAHLTWDFTVDKGARIRPDQTPWGSCDLADPVRFVVTPALLIDGELCRGQVVYTSPDAGAAMTGPQPALSPSSAGKRSGRRSPR